MDKVITKICTKCKLEKSIDDFSLREYHYNSQIKKYRRSQCKQCRVKIQQNYYSPEIREERKQKRATTKKELVIRFGNRCLDCKQSFPYYVYEFHHLDETKKGYHISKILLDRKQKLEDEIKKCIMLCANCHKIRHNKNEN